jgi:hypothetical protein
MWSAKQNFASEIVALKEQLASVVATLAALANATSVGERGSYSIKEFLARNQLSESQYHKLRRQGRGPRLMSVGSCGVRISRQAEIDWIAAREQEAKAASRGTAPSESETGAPEEHSLADESDTLK